MLLIRVQYKTQWKAGDCINVPVRNKYSFFHFPEPVEIRIGDTLYTTEPNAVIISRPDEPRWFYFPKDTQFNFFHGRLALGPLLEENRIPLGCILYPRDPEFLNGCFKRIRMEYLSEEEGAEALQDIYIKEMLVLLGRSIRRQQAVADSKLQMKLFKLRLELLSRPGDKWTVEEMARRVSLSPSRFHVVYKAQFRISPMRDLINARIDQAKALLLENREETLAVIAERLGYKNPYDFCRQFTKATGISPGAYRKNSR